MAEDMVAGVVPKKYMYMYVLVKPWTRKPLIVSNDNVTHYIPAQLRLAFVLRIFHVVSLKQLHSTVFNEAFGRVVLNLPQIDQNMRNYNLLDGR